MIESLTSRVVVVEDDPVVRAEVAARILQSGELELAGEASTLAAARQLVARVRPAFAVCDLQLPDGNALTLLPELRAAGIAVLVLTVSADDVDVYRALACGAGGYLLKSDALDKVREALVSLRDGGAPISPRIARWLMDDFRARAAQEPTAETPRLTPREWEVVEQFSTGATYVEVGRALDMTVNTVRQHVRSLYEKLHVCSKTEAVLRVRELGLRRGPP
jgi:DNA-binding NarL/FixJ family response regulator